jgi:hypothetical protein
MPGWVNGRLITIPGKSAKGGLCRNGADWLEFTSSKGHYDPSQDSHITGVIDFFLKSATFGISGISRSSRILPPSD